MRTQPRIRLLVLLVLAVFSCQYATAQKKNVVILATGGTIAGAAVSFDQTGTTKIGKYLLNHSFMLPGLVTITSTIVIALLLSKFL